VRIPSIPVYIATKEVCREVEIGQRKKGDERGE